MLDGFNEAPAISPGNRRFDHEGATFGEDASMRPRRFRRGIKQKINDAANTQKGFNEAPAISPGNLTLDETYAVTLFRLQ